MVRREYLRLLSGCIALLTVVGCSEAPTEENAECSQGATRELACGRYGTSTQQQICGPRFRWINEGVCQEDIQCAHDEKLYDPCGGLNGNAERLKVCKLGEWPEAWGACIDPDVCLNDTVETEYCVGPAGGRNGNATKERTCVDGQWAAFSACVDPDTCTDNRPDLNDCVNNAICLQRAGTFDCHCAPGFVEDEDACLDINECDDETLNTCAEPTLCVNTPGSFNCSCPEGRIDFLGDGTVCKSLRHVTVGAAHTCALSEHSDLYCWGRNEEGQLGTGQKNDTEHSGHAKPIHVGEVETWSSVEAGGRYTRAFNETGEVFYWGGAPIQLPGYASGEEVLKLPTIAAKDISVGQTHTCAVTMTGALYCWGANDHGQLGTGDTVDAPFPQRIGNQSTWAQVAVGGKHSCGIRTNGALYCWGQNNDGQLGIGSSSEKSVPTRVGEPYSSWVHVTAGLVNTCAFDDDGILFCWGDNMFGQLGVGTAQAAQQPTEVTALPFPTIDVSAGAQYTCAVTDDGSLYCWGHNNSGQLGDQSTTQRSSPKRIEAEAGWSNVATGDYHTCGLREGNLLCWGLNDYGQLGDGTRNPRYYPNPI